MQIDKHIHRSSSRLILFFNGWSASPDLFRPLAPPEETDVWICYDYRDLTFDDTIKSYSDIHLVAWSLGVWVAEQIGKQYPALPIRTATAVNGTPHPIDDRYGIPPALFQGTLANLSSEGIARFTRRICGNRQLLETYNRVPCRPTEIVEAELHALYRFIRSANDVPTPSLATPTECLPEGIPNKGTNLPSPSGFPLEDALPSSIPWSHAIISQQDRIFPPDNLRRYWAGRCALSEPEAPHYPFHLWNQWQEIWNQ